MKAAVLHGPRDLRVESAPLAPARARGGARSRRDVGPLRHRLPDLGRRPARCSIRWSSATSSWGSVEDVGAEVTRVRVGAPGGRRAQLLLRRLRPLPRGQSKPLPEADRRRHRCRRLFCRARSRARALLLARARERRPTTTSWSTEPLAVVVRAVAKARRRPGETAAVVGGGTLGLLALQVLRAHGARVLVVSRTARRFALARELGAEATHVVGRRLARGGGPAVLRPRGRGRGDRDRGHGRGGGPRAGAGEARAAASC